MDYIAANPGQAIDAICPGILAIRPGTTKASLQTQLYRGKKSGALRVEGSHGSYRYFVAVKGGT